MAVSRRDIETVRHDMDLEEELDVHVRRWRLRSVVAGLIGVLFVLAALGLFGNGPLSSATVNQGDNELRYERFARFGNETRLEFRLRGGEIALPLDYLKSFRLDRVIPQPRAQRVQDGRAVFSFDSSGELRAYFHLVPRDPGLVRTVVTVDGASLPVTHFVYP